MQADKKMYETARTTIACAKYGKNVYVNVRYCGLCDGIEWFYCWQGEETPEHTAVYPEHHLTNFCL